MNSIKQLSRTTLLFQADLGLPSQEIVMSELMAPTISLVADREVASSYSGQIAITTAAMLMARAGATVFIDAPDVPLIGHQPPMSGRTLHEAVSSVGGKLIEGALIAVGCPLLGSDIAFVFGGGAAGIGVRADRIVALGWTEWSGELTAWPRGVHSSKKDWPFGAMAAATLAAAEAIKIVGRKLALRSSHPTHFEERFAASNHASLVLAPPDTPMVSNLENFDIISAGAVSNAFLYALLRIPDVSGHARTFDRDLSEASNRNRNMLLLPEFEGLPKVNIFRHFQAGLNVEPVARHFKHEDLPTLAPRIAVGVDDVPTRWLLAGAAFDWMGVGATSHFDSMVSVHYPFSACAACMHPHDEPMDGPTPTLAVVSFLSGLMMAAEFLRDVAHADISSSSRHRYLTPLQMGGAWSGPVAPASNCPARCHAARRRA